MPNSSFSQNQPTRRQNRNYAAWRTSGSLASSIAATICCLFVLSGAIFGLTYSSSYFEPWLETEATVVGTEKRFQNEEDTKSKFEYCPQIQFFTLDDSRNITTVLKTSCEKDAWDVRPVGNKVDIQYDPSYPDDVVDAGFPGFIRVLTIFLIVVSTLCSCGYVVAGIIISKATNANSSAQNNHSVPCDNNHTGPSSIPMSNLGGDSNQYTESSAYNFHNYTSNGPVETTAAAVPIAQHEVQTQASDTIVSAVPEGIRASTAIASGETEPPMVGATLVSSTVERNSQTYVSPSSLPTFRKNTPIYKVPD